MNKFKCHSDFLLLRALFFMPLSFFLLHLVIMDSDRDTFHVVIKLPFSRPDDFTEPPSVNIKWCVFLLVILLIL